jgi:thioredoxin reductase
MDDVAIVGGSYAGLSAALQLARARRRVVIVDAGERRNRFAAHAHGLLGHDGRAPAAIAAAGRAEVLAYPTVRWIEGTATRAKAIADGFALDLASGQRITAHRLVLGVGVVDELPPLPGLAERWGRTVFHCPYCHGYELGGGQNGVLATSPMSIHHAIMLPDWGPTTYFTQAKFEPNDEEGETLARRGVTIERTPVTAVEGEERDVLLRLDDGRALAFAGLFVLPTTRIASPLALELGCDVEHGPIGTYLKTDVMQETTVPGVFACGDVAVMAGGLAGAIGDGARAGVAAHRSLIFGPSTQASLPESRR